MGALIALLILLCWTAHLFYVLPNGALTWQTPISYCHIALQGYLSTGLFITAHDAMHGSVSKTRWLNHTMGFVACFLFAAMWYPQLRKNHYRHHAEPASENDPDFYVGSQNFWLWLGAFLTRYATWQQLVIMATLYNVMERVFLIPESRIWMFWMIPSFLGALQLFYFGTYRPHKLPLTAEMLPHNARTLRKNHVWAMLSCYFFGYHWEHHHSPSTPWWELWKEKEKLTATKKVA